MMRNHSRSRSTTEGPMTRRSTTLLMCLSCLMLTGIGPVSGGLLFPNPLTDSGQRSQAIVAGDFNGDGKADLIVANMISYDFSVLLGRGDGTFAPQTTYRNLSPPVALAVGDFNRDCRQDGGSGGQYPGELWIHLGNGDGTFTRTGSLSVYNYPRCIVAADLTGSGVLSLVVGSEYGEGVVVLQGRGDGTFLPGVAYGQPGAVASVATGDLDGDGLIDIAVAGTNNLGTGHNVSILLGKGGDTSARQPPILTGGQYSTVVVADFDDDGRADLASAGYVGSDAAAMLWMWLSRTGGVAAAPVSVPLG